MSGMGFHEKWVNWIMMCVSTVTFSVLINDQPFGLITPQRGTDKGIRCHHFFPCFVRKGCHTYLT